MCKQVNWLYGDCARRASRLSPPLQWTWPAGICDYCEVNMCLFGGLLILEATTNEPQLVGSAELSAARLIASAHECTTDILVKQSLSKEN